MAQGYEFESFKFTIKVPLSTQVRFAQVCRKMLINENKVVNINF